MDINYEFDYIKIGMVTLAIIIGGYLIFSGKEKVTSLKSGYAFILLGFLLIIISVVFHSLYNHNWGGNYIIAFLLFKNVNQKLSQLLIFRFICGLGYILVGWGIELLLAFVRSKRDIKIIRRENE